MFFKYAEIERTCPVILLCHMHVLECFNEKICVLFLNIFLSALTDIWYKSGEGNTKWISKRFFSYLPEKVEEICYLRHGKLQYSIRCSFCFEQRNKAPILSVDKHSRDKVHYVTVLIVYSFFYKNTAKTKKQLSTKTVVARQEEMNCCFPLTFLK